MIDLSGELGARAERKLQQERVIWLTTIGPDLTPQPRPVWFLWQGESLVTYSRPDAHKIEHIERHPNVALHFNTDPRGQHVVVLLGEARLPAESPPATEVPGYIEKYRQSIARLGSTPERFAREYSVAVRVEPFKLRGF